MEIKPFEKKIWLSSPTMHGNELKWVQDAFEKNWITTAGDNVNAIESEISAMLSQKYAVGLSCGTAALHLALKAAGEKIYGMPKPGTHVLSGHRVATSDMTFAATCEPIFYEGGEAVFIDSERDTWNMSPESLENAFALYPDIRIVVLAHLYGTPAKINEIKAICDKHGAILIEDAAESLGATYRNADGEWVQTGSSSYSCISFNGNKIITGSSGGMFLTDSKETADKVRKWSTQSREAAPWYEHEELGFNYRISNIIAGIVRGQLENGLSEHIEAKRRIYERYKAGFKGLPVTMNPYDEENSVPNFWLSCMLIDENAMCRQVRSGREALYIHEKGKTCPTEILETLAKYNAEGRPIWKPMHLQPFYSSFPFITAQGNGRARSNAYIADNGCVDVGADIFNRGLCLPSDNKMTEEEQDIIIQIIRSCFE